MTSLKINIAATRAFWFLFLMLALTTLVTISRPGIALSMQQPTFQAPTIGVITSINGYNSDGDYNHQGVDIADVERSPVFPIALGRIVYQGCEPDSYGWSVIIEHELAGQSDKLWSRYAHMGSRDQSGQCGTSYIEDNLPQNVDQSTQLGGQGNSGKVRGTTGIHLHLEVRSGQGDFVDQNTWWTLTPVDPANYVDLLQGKSQGSILCSIAIGEGASGVQRQQFLDFYRTNGSIVDFRCPVDKAQYKNNLLVQQFEGPQGAGRAIVWQPNDKSLRWLSTRILDAYLKDGGPTGTLGPIVSNEYFFDGNLARRVDFENGSLLQYGSATSNSIERLDASNGWLAEYFVISSPANEDDGGPVLGNPVFRRYDPGLGSYVAFDWNTGSPDPARIGDKKSGTADWFAARWTGTFNTSIPGLLRFDTWTDDGSRLWVDDKLIIDAWAARPAEKRSKTITLGSGQHRVKFEYYETTGRAYARLAWAPPLVGIVWAEDTGASNPELPPSPEPDGRDGDVSVVPPVPTGATVTMLVLDVSGSMSENWRGGVKIESAKSAANQIVNMLQQESQVSATPYRLGLATFTTDASLNLPLTSDYNQARSAINSLIPQQNTNLGDGLIVANQALGQVNPSESKVIVLLSDGLTNAGLPPDQILSGPVQEAVNAGTCIYTIGFGDPGSFDEDLLRRIAAASGCGQYHYATDVNELQKIYIRVRHVSTGNLLAELSGTVAQGQTVQAGTVSVPSGQDELAISLNWPGSALDLQLTDPQGKAVDQTYPGANIASYSNLVYALIQKPISGTWQVAVYGREVPEGTTIFDALASVRPSPVLPTPEPAQPVPAPAATVPTSSPGPAIVVMLAVIAAGGVGIYALVKRQPQRVHVTSGAEHGLASLVFNSGLLAGQTVSVPTTGLMIGRGSACNLRLEDPAVSRQHARIRYATGAWFIQDLSSGGGTFVNGQRVQAMRLNAGDQIQIGSSLFTFQVLNR